MKEQELQSIEDILYSESLHCDALIYKNKPFSFLKQMNTLYFGKGYDMEEINDFSLDHYNWLRKNNVYHDTIRTSLMSTFRMMLKQYDNNTYYEEIK